MPGIGTIAALLAQAEHPGTGEVEAAAFMQKAVELAARANVDLAVARMHQKDKTAREICEQRWTHTRAPGEWRRGLQSQWGLELYKGLAKVNDLIVRASSSGDGTHAFGFPSDHAVTDAMWNSLMVQMVQQANAAIRRGDHKEKVWVEAGESNGFTEPAKTSGYRLRSKVTGQVFRANYYQGFVDRIIERCWEAKRDAERGDGTQNPDPTSGTALAVRAKKDEVKEEYDAYRLRQEIEWGWKNADGTWTQEVLDKWAKDDRKGRVYRAPRGYEGPTIPASSFGQNAGRAGAEVASLGAETRVGAAESRGLPS